ncbi:hypothetical protein VTN02DRAFT_437 [Thermoascus thermophilus]
MCACSAKCSGPSPSALVLGQHRFHSKVFAKCESAGIQEQSHHPCASVFYAPYAGGASGRPVVTWPSLSPTTTCCPSRMRPTTMPLATDLRIARRLTPDASMYTRPTFLMPPASSAVAAPASRP